MLPEFLVKITSLSVPQTTRLNRRYLLTRQVRASEYRRRQFPRRYHKDDVVLLVSVAEAHGRLSGPATKKVLERGAGGVSPAQFALLPGVSVSRLYNLRQTTTYRRRGLVMGKTTKGAIGERRRPAPAGRPGLTKISEHYLIPVLQAMLEQFPFRIRISLHQRFG